jgi:hypothetical protein
LAIVLLVVAAVAVKCSSDDRRASSRASMSDARSVFAERSPITISVLGDSIGNDVGE